LPLLLPFCNLLDASLFCAGSAVSVSLPAWVLLYPAALRLLRTVDFPCRACWNTPCERLTCAIFSHACRCVSGACLPPATRCLGTFYALSTRLPPPLPPQCAACRAAPLADRLLTMDALLLPPDYGWCLPCCRADSGTCHCLPGTSIYLPPAWSACTWVHRSHRLPPAHCRGRLGDCCVTCLPVLRSAVLPTFYTGPHTRLLPPHCVSVALFCVTAVTVHLDTPASSAGRTRTYLPVRSCLPG